VVYRRTARAEKVREASRRKILKAARELFTSRGYEQTTVQDIVRRARTSVGNLYFYFADKETIFVELARVLIAEQRRRIAEVIAPEPPGAFRVALLEYVRGHLVQHFGPLFLEAITCGATRVRDLVVASVIDRSKWVLTDSAPWLSDEEREVAAVMLFGGTVQLELEHVAGRLATDPQVRFWVRTRTFLRGVGFPDAEIERALAELRDRIPAIDPLVAWHEPTLWNA
jgi:AcrR family transcriptional regulator